MSTILGRLTSAVSGLTSRKHVSSISMIPMSYASLMSLIPSTDNPQMTTTFTGTVVYLGVVDAGKAGLSGVAVIGVSALKT